MTRSRRVSVGAGALTMLGTLAASPPAGAARDFVFHGRLGPDRAGVR